MNPHKFVYNDKISRSTGQVTPELSCPFCHRQCYDSWSTEMLANFGQETCGLNLCEVIRNASLT